MSSLRLLVLLVGSALAASCSSTVSVAPGDAAADRVEAAWSGDVLPPKVEAGSSERDVSTGGDEDVSSVSFDAGTDEDVVAPPEDVGELDATADLDVPAEAATDAPSMRDTSPAGDVRPAGLRDPPPVPRYSNGSCPVLRGGATSDASLVTGFRSGSTTRSFRLLVPRSYDGTQDYPLVFAWHWLNASASSFIRQAEMETAVEQMRFIAVLPESVSSYVFDWPFAEFWGIPSELQFFDDLYSCVTQRFRVDRRRVHGIGVSAGGLWLTYLSTTERANYFGSIEVLSGGLGEVPFAWRMAYMPQANKFPALVLWGGPTDFLGVNFDQASQRLRDELVRDHHFVLQCVHGMGHALPPIAPPAGGGTRFRALWQFFLDHPFGSAPGASPYFAGGLPADFPSWCSIASRP